ncbi:porin [Candidatus Uabimicrobium amorphum]|uniref:Porin n=1 Tax=Uabimicrobium amorphum TaxID=2596890 RepID=A0A5S9F3Y2_UABAM|nr:porin [Candidatus Uabimicrobium amorphum]BBM84009.1 porin [Candidatus Uabimicrobium amorphum]
MLYRILIIIACINILWSQEQSEIQQLREEIKALKNRVETLEEQLEQKNSPTGKEYDQQAEKIDSLEKKVGQYDEVIRALEEQEKSDDDFEVFWDNKLVLRSINKEIKITFGGFAQLDIGFIHEDAAITEQIDRAEDFADFRSFRPTITGEIGRYFFVFQPDLAIDNEIAFRNVFFGMKGLPFNGTLQVGFFREFISLEAVQGLPFLTFMDRASLVDLTPGFQLGAQYMGRVFDERLTFAAGIFREVEDDDPPRVEDGGSYAGTFRVTGLPIYEEQGKYLMHLGAGYSYRSPLDNRVQFNARPEIDNGPQFVDTGVIENVNDVQLFSFEWAAVMSSFSLQSEAMVAVFDIDGNDKENVWAFYVFASYLLTGEYRPYLKKAATFGGVSPFNSFLDEENATGAIELAVRYSRIDLNDDTVRGRRMDDITLGVNWYINPFIRVQVNYIYSILRNLDAADFVDAHILAMRLQVTF